MEPKTPNTGSESPASVTYSITSKDGFNALFTLREESGEKLLQKMAVVESKLLALQYKPQVKQMFGKKEVKYVEGKVCPLCKGRLIEKTKTDGKPYHKCENGKFNPLTKQTDGCNFVDWLNPKISTQEAGANEDMTWIEEA